MLILMKLALYSTLSEAALTCPSYPIGLTSTGGSVNYTALDVSKNGERIVIGGDCMDSTLCPGGALPNPIIELVDATNR